MFPDSGFHEVLKVWADRGERTLHRIEGNCMAPIIREGDLLLIEHGPARLRRGDVVVLGKPDGFRVHRVIRIDCRGGKESLIVKPDQPQSPSVAVTREQILGRVVEVRGSNGRLRFNSLYWIGINALVALLSRGPISPPSWAPAGVILKRLVLPAYDLSTRFPGCRTRR